ncbi:hypothetical protein AB0E25_41625 [Streptomyces bobili]|uniref:hypothetical protein n=1 Tax=Streptomyces bobili TaxID=67280 RepID=UPI0033C6F3EA
MAAARKGELVPRPPKKIECETRFATADAQKGWRDLVATIRNPMTETLGLPHADATVHDADELSAQG